MGLRNKNGKILNVLLSVISLLVIIFIIIWVVSKNNNRASYDEIFTNNLNNMQEIAKEYFAQDLPEKTNDEVKLTLDEMIDKNLTKELKYGKTVCSKDDSYISIVKVSNDEYKVTSNLVCGSKSDNIIEKIKLTTSVEDEDGEKIVDSKEDDVDLNVETNTTTNKTTVYCSGIECPVIKIETDCEVAYEYEYVKRTASCQDGYSYISGKCVKTTDETIEATSTKNVTDAKKASGTEKVYVDATKSTTDGTYSCENGELSGKYCYEYKDKETKTETSCPDGYTKSGDSCYKYADQTSSTTTSCPDGYTKSGDSCYKYASLNSSTSYSCPSGYTKSGSKCYYYSNASIGYSKWGNPVKTYSTKTKEYTYTHTLQKKILAGSRTVKGITYYTYSIYTRTSYYYCNSGSVSGKYCYHSTNATASTTYSCPTGYTKSGNSCYIKTNATSSTTTSCPSGYTQDGNKCYIKTNVNSSSSSSCPTGYTDNGSKCYKKTDATYTNGTTTYTCPTGYTKNGTKCYKEVTTTGDYYCENASATLFGNKCIIESAKTNCKNGYTYNENDGLCHKTTSEYANVTYKTVDTIYSAESSLSGYQKTGRANYTMTCTPSVTK